MNIEEARRLFPATEKLAYFNTAGTSLGSTVLSDAYSKFIGDWTEGEIDAVRAEQAGENARNAFAKIIGARDGNLRMSVHFYNHSDDIDRLIAALKNW